MHLWSAVWWNTWSTVYSCLNMIKGYIGFSLAVSPSVCMSFLLTKHSQLVNLSPDFFQIHNMNNIHKTLACSMYLSILSPSCTEDSVQKRLIFTAFIKWWFNWFKPSSKIFLLIVPRRYFFYGSFVVVEMRKLRGKMLILRSLLSCLLPYLKELILWFTLPLLPSIPPTTSVPSLPHIMLAGEKWLGWTKIIYKGTSAQIFKLQIQISFSKNKWPLV